MTENNKPIKHEVEDFEKTISFQSGEFAIIDAKIVKSLKDKVPIDQVIYVPVKQSENNKITFTVSALYDDAALNELTIKPLSSSDNGETANNDMVKEGIQILGHESDPVNKKISKISRISGELRPKTAHRSERNKRYSAKGDQKSKIHNTTIDSRINHKLSIKGARRNNYGQGHKIENECIELINHVKNKTITESYLKSLDHLSEVRNILSNIRSNVLVKGKSFDIVYEAVEILNNHINNENIEWVKKLED